jgi:SOS-response transcriptional repressor LexA
VSETIEAVEEVKLTDKQRDLYLQIVHYKRENWITPTVRELSGYNGTSHTNVWKLLRILQKKGYIKIVEKKSRGIIIV